MQHKLVFFVIFSEYCITKMRTINPFQSNQINKNILTLVLILFTFVSFSQEYDDLYFNKNDRKTIVQKNNLSAQEIINQYKNDLTLRNVELKDNINPDLLNKYKSNSQEVLDKRVKVISKSLKYNRDNLFFRPSKNNYNNYFKNFYGLSNSGSYGYSDPFAYERLVNGYYYDPFMNNMSWSNSRWLTKLYRYNPLLLFSDPYFSMYHGNTMFSPIDFWGYNGYGFNSICVLSTNNPYGLYSYGGNYGNNYINNNYINNTFNTMNNVSNQIRGPRVSRNSGSINGENVDQFVKRGRSLVREGEINNDGRYQRGSNSQNEYLRSKVSNERNLRNDISSRSDTRNNYNDQLSRRRGMNSENTSVSSKKAMRIYSSYDQNTSRSSINRGSGYERNSSSRNNGSLNDNSGRRSSYNYSKESYTRNSNSNSSFYNRSNSSTNRSNSNYSSGTAGFNRSSGSGFSSGGVSSGSSRVGGSSGGNSGGGSSKGGGSSRGGVN